MSPARTEASSASDFVTSPWRTIACACVTCACAARAAALERGHALGGEHGAVVGPHHVHAGGEPRPFRRGAAGVGGADCGAPAGPRVGVEDGLLHHDAALVVADRARIVEALRIEVRLGDRALAERGAEDADGIGGADVAGLEANGGKDALERHERGAGLGAGIGGGDAVAVGRPVGLVQRAAKRELGAGAVERTAPCAEQHDGEQQSVH